MTPILRTAGHFRLRLAVSQWNRAGQGGRAEAGQLLSFHVPCSTIRNFSPKEVKVQYDGKQPATPAATFGIRCLSYGLTSTISKAD